MKAKLSTIALVAVLFCAAAHAQDSPGGAFGGQVPVNASLKKSLSSENAKVGQEIVAVTEKPVTINGTVLPRGSFLQGHVVDVTKHTKATPNGSLTIVFDHAQPKKGSAFAIHASVYRISLSENQIRVMHQDVDMGMRGTGAEQSTTSALREGTDQQGRTVTGMVSNPGAPIQVVSAIPDVALSAVSGEDKSAIMAARNKDVDLDGGTEMIVGVAAK